MADTTTEQKTGKPFIESIAEFLTNDEWNFEREGEDGNAIQARVRGNRATFRIRFVVDEEDSLVTFLVFGPTVLPDELRPEVLELLNMMNHRYMVGSFELSVARSEVIFRVGYDLEGATLSSQMIRNMIGLGTSAYDRIFPALMAVCFAGVSPASAVVSMEGRASTKSDN